eukprot:SAG31_NODE_3520_length_4165_cov_1.856370_3_plen_70_part_00
MSELEADMSVRQEYVSKFIEAAVLQDWNFTVPPFIETVKLDEAMMEALKNPHYAGPSSRPSSKLQMHSL